MGRKTAAAFAKHERYLADALGISKVRWVTIPHYSAANSRVHGNSPERYRRLVTDALNGV